MQTFLPHRSFERSARSLDSRRLGKQRVEAFQLLRAISLPDHGWRHHPAAKMWKGYDDALKAYMNACIHEWVRRGYVNNMKLAEVPEAYELPPWLGKKRLHASHRSNLLRKDADYYGQFGWTEPPDMPYWWPVTEAVADRKAGFKADLSSLPKTKAGARRLYDFARAHTQKHYAHVVRAHSKSRADVSKWTFDSFLDEYVWVVLASGFKARTVGLKFEAFRRACGDWRDRSGEERRKAAALKVFGNVNKVNAVFTTFSKMRVWTRKAEGNEAEGFRRFWRRYLSKPEQMTKLPFIGPITCYHLAKNLGNLDYAKPDVHLERLAQHFGFEGAQVMCEFLASAYKEPPSVVDLRLWFVASDFGTRWASPVGDKRGKRHG